MRPGGNERNEADENAYDSVAPSGASGSKAKPSKGDAPVLYSTVDKENRQGRPVSYTVLLCRLVHFRLPVLLTGA